MAIAFLANIATNLILKFSYVAIFFLSLISSSTIFLPLPLYGIEFVVVALGMHPLIVGICAGFGSAIGELTGYLTGLGGRYVIETARKSKVINAFTTFFKKHGFLTIVLISLTPFPFDFIGILAGASHYDIKNFFIATFIGKTLRSVLIAFSGYFIGTPIFEWLGIIKEIP